MQTVPLLLTFVPGEKYKTPGDVERELDEAEKDEPETARKEEAK